MNEELKFYQNTVLPWRQRAEQAEAMCQLLGDLLKQMSAEVCKGK